MFYGEVRNWCVQSGLLLLHVLQSDRRNVVGYPDAGACLKILWRPIVVCQRLFQIDRRSFPVWGVNVLTCREQPVIIKELILSTMLGKCYIELQSVAIRRSGKGDICMMEFGNLANNGKS